MNHIYITVSNHESYLYKSVTMNHIYITVSNHESYLYNSQ